MGQELLQDSFLPSDYGRFAARLDDCIDALARLLERPDFDPAPVSLGAELEMSLMRPNGRPAGVNLALLEALDDARFTPELDSFNLEFNSSPLPLAGRPLTSMAGQLRGALASVREAAGAQGALPVMVGILPTLRAEDLGPPSMTPMTRYRALDKVLRAHRGQPFRININGMDPLYLEEDCITFEGANTSLQLHLKLPPARFVRSFNAAQMALGPALAVVGNSPFFLQHRLWEETRIVVFKQTVDDRDPSSSDSHASPRIGIGRGWWTGTPAEGLARHLRSHDILLPICSDEDIDARLAAGEVPALRELCIHNGTIWHWNRPVYDPAGGGQLRIEFRALPSGPTVADMMANAALMLGLSLALAAHGPDCEHFPFDKVEYNLYRAAQNGLAARLLWPEPSGALRVVAARELLADWLPAAETALVEAGIDAGEAAEHLAVIRARLANGQTGSRWQHNFLTAANVKLSRDEVLHQMIQRYQSLSHSGEPVHSWPSP